MKEHTLRLVYHFWDGTDENIKKLHFALLKHYAHIFTDVIFVIAADDVGNVKKINEIQHEIIDIGFTGTLTIRVESNDTLRETKTYKEEIVDKLSELDGLTLFAHSRGGSCDYIEPEYLYHLIIFLYYGCLNWMDEVDKDLHNVYRYITYGGIEMMNPNATETDYPFSKYKWYYQGTFYWINTQKVFQYMRNNNWEIPPMTDRYYSENGFLPNLFDVTFTSNHTKCVITDAHGDYFNDTYESIRKSLNSDEEYQEYINFANDLLEKTLGIRYDR